MTTPPVPHATPPTHTPGGPPPSGAEERLILDVLASARTIAIVGASADPSRASSFVAAYLLRHGFEIWPVNPRGGEILGRHVFRSLAELPAPPDVVDVFRRPADCPDVARAAVAARARVLWLQLRIVSDEAAAIARAAGLGVVMDRCLKIEHGRYLGGLHAAGMNTGILSARRRPLRSPRG